MFMLILLPVQIGLGQSEYNHPELKWYTFETEHFSIHFHDGTENSAREGAFVAEKIYPLVTGLYEFEPEEKTHLVFIDTDDYSNGIAYFYDNKIYIWTSPLQFQLRGNHRWLQNVLTHEFVHIVSMQKAMKFGRTIPGFFFQWMGYENEKRKDVLYGYPDRLLSYPLPGTTIPPWLAEGISQYMYENATFDSWDTHRDMILRDHVLHDTILSFEEMNTFGKKGIGNESTYNAGYAFVLYIVSRYGPSKLREIFEDQSRMHSYSINGTIKRVLGISAKELHREFRATLENRYEILMNGSADSSIVGNILRSEGTANLHPKWAPDGIRFAYLSNKKNDYFGQTDLYVMNTSTGAEEMIAASVTSAAAWSPDGNCIVYSGLPKYPDRNGSKYFDLYKYDFRTDKTEKLTENLRTYSPVWLSDSTRIAYLTTRDGTQNVFILDLQTAKRTRLTSYSTREILAGLYYDRTGNRLIFDRTVNHFSDIAYISLDDSLAGDIVSSEYWDERNGCSDENWFIYADDRSGIFNLYGISNDGKEQGYFTDVNGGAFMPDISRDGKIVYSLYSNGGYKIALIDSMHRLDPETVGYSPNYFKKNFYLEGPVTDLDSTVALDYRDRIPPMFFMPRVMVDYGTLKPGFYFYSSEVLNRISMSGSASINKLGDLDLFLQFTMRRFYPTLYLDFMVATRNIRENSLYRVYKLDDHLKFRFIGLKGGMRIPIMGQSIDLFALREMARAFIKQSIPQENLEGGIAYDYYRGTITGLTWKFSSIKPRLNQNINPGHGFSVFSLFQYEKNDFISGLDLSDAGTIVEKFRQNDGFRLQLSGDLHLTMPGTENVTASFNLQNGYFSYTKVDSFFHFFAGGMPGLKGYPYYSIQGTNLAIGTAAFRFPVFIGKHFTFQWLTLQNSTVGIILQVGDAWISGPEPKTSLGLEWRVNGYSFYNYPTAIGLEIHKGLTTFEVGANGDTWPVENEPRFYFTLLFEF